jgi:NAD(P)-dependent dehydrogenase (short-subunit alcohol dehydrogenase family)
MADKEPNEMEEPGIGRATAVAFARNGANVVVSGRRDETGEALVDD